MRCTLESPERSESWNVSKIVQIPRNTNLTLPVLQIPLWSDSGLVLRSLWFSCFSCWLCWRRQVPHIKSKSGLLCASHRTRQGTRLGPTGDGEVGQAWIATQIQVLSRRDHFLPRLLTLVNLIKSGFLVLPCHVHAAPRSEFYTEVKMHLLPFLKRFLWETLAANADVFTELPGSSTSLPGLHRWSPLPVVVGSLSILQL